MAATQSFFKTPNATRFTRPDCRKPDPFSPTLTQNLKPHSLNNSWLGTTKLSLHSSNLRPVTFKHLPIITATVVSSLPTKKSDGVSSTVKVPKWSSKAIKSFAMGELEARKLKYPNTGTEALLMGILIEGTNQASKILRTNGVTLMKVREEIVKLLGKADMYFFSPEHPPLTEEAQRALDWAIEQKLKSGEDGEVTTVHQLLGIWSEEESPGHKVMATLGFNSETAQQLYSLISEPGYVES
ncbi:ATP-dependent Clp protease ATP-binding subunit CLPT2, chloroplastic-like [Apium graveolens]|uniref:ATP-dependent Clp protease ATP-binding subunit CLPT2, chloroplastic-like n=1 Tax=Apium graveolens TaxID=4045 RepID=UPI003D7B779C